jgi:hypothetical protein
MEKKHAVDDEIVRWMQQLSSILVISLSFIT